MAQSRLRGSLTVEAALSLSLFIFMVILLAMPLDMLATRRSIQMTLESTGRDLSKKAWLLTCRDGEKNAESDADTDTSLLGTAAVQAYLMAKLASGNEASKIEQIDVTGSRISADGEIIDLRVSYRAKLPLGVFSVKNIPFTARCFRRGWIGSAGLVHHGAEDAGKEETMVYVGRDSTRYHRSPSCHYLSNHIRAVAAGDIGKAKNDSDRRYRPCAVCGRTAGSGVYYVLPEGEVYHTDPECSSLSAYVRKVPLSEVEYLGPCSYCGGGP